MHTANSKDWREKAAEKRQQLNAKIPDEWRLPQLVLEDARLQRSLVPFLEDLLDHRTLEITSLNSVAIINAVKSGALTAVEVTRAFCKRTAFAHQLVRYSMPRLDMKFSLSRITRTIIFLISFSSLP